MVTLYKYHVRIVIECEDFEAESEQEAIDLVDDSISDNYGLHSAIITKEIYKSRKLK